MAAESHARYRSMSDHTESPLMSPVFPPPTSPLAGGETEMGEFDVPLLLRPGRKPRCLCCFKRRLTCVLVVGLCIAVVLAVFVAIFRWAIMPAVVADFVNASPLHFSSVNLTEPRHNSVHLVGEAHFNKPPVNIPVAFTAPRVDVAYVSPDTGTHHAIGHFSVKPAATVTSAGSVLLSTVLVVEDLHAFSNMTQALVNNPVLKWYFSGQLDFRIDVWGVHVQLPGIKMRKYIDLTGCSGFPDVNIDDFMVSQEGDDPVVELWVSLTNPSPVSILPVGDVKFLVTAHVDGTRTVLGPAAVVEDMVLRPGRNQLKARGVLRPDNLEVANHVISRYLQGEPNALTATVPPNGCHNKLYSAGLQGLSLSTVLPGNTVKIIESGTGLANITLVLELLRETHHVDVPVRLEVHNPLDVSITMFSVDGYVLYNNTEYGLQPVGFADVLPQQPPNITIPKHSHFYAPEVPIKVLLNDTDVIDDLVIAFLQVLQHNESHVSIYADISIQVGTTSYTPTVYYKAYDIPLFVAP